MQFSMLVEVLCTLRNEIGKNPNGVEWNPNLLQILLKTVWTVQLEWNSRQKEILNWNAEIFTQLQFWVSENSIQKKLISLSCSLTSTSFENLIQFDPGWAKLGVYLYH